MERLLKDAEKLSGVKYDIDNLGDVYSAIHVIQEDLGLTGVAAEEAATTFTGSFEAMKASVTNLMADLATGNGEAIYQDIQTLFDGLGTFVFDNLIPMMSNIVERVPQLIANLIYEIGNVMKEQAQNAPAIVDFAITFITQTADALIENIPYLIEGAAMMLIELGKALINYDWIGTARAMFNNFKASIDQATYDIFGNDTSLLETLVEWISNTLPQMVNEGIEIMFSLIDGIIESLPDIVETILTVVTKMLATFTENLPKIIEMGFKIITKLITGLIQTIPKLVAALPQIFKAIKDTFGAYDWVQIGKDILIGIKNGIISMISAVVQAAVQAASAIYNSVRGFFKIGSPSKLMNQEIGRWIPAGIAVGIEGNMGEVLDAMDDLNNASIGQMDVDSFRYSPTMIPNVNNKTVSQQNEEDMNSNIRSAIKSALADGVTIDWNGRNLGRLVQTYA